MKKIPLKQRLGDDGLSEAAKTFRRVCALSIDDCFHAFDLLGERPADSFSHVRAPLLSRMEQEGDTLVTLAARLAGYPPEKRTDCLYTLLLFPFLTLEAYL